jgi:uncharacterized protein
LATGRLLGLCVLVILSALSFGCPGGSGEPEDFGDVLSVTIKGEAFELELALDDETRLQGLSDRPSIADNGGMLFGFSDEQNRAFVMRRCLVPIDIAFLNADGEVIWMHAMQVEDEPDVPDNRLKPYISHYPAQFAIELKEGTIRRLGLSQGDRIDLPLDELKRRVQ